MKNILYLLIALFGLACTPTDAPQAPVKTNEIKVEKRIPELKPDRYNVALLIMDGVYNTELTAPYDIFQHTIFRDSIKAMNTFMVANTLNPITSFEGMRILPDYNLSLIHI